MLSTSVLTRTYKQHSLTRSGSKASRAPCWLLTDLVICYQACALPCIRAHLQPAAILGLDDGAHYRGVVDGNHADAAG